MTKAEITTDVELFRVLVGVANDEAPKRPYAAAVAEFTDAVASCLLQGRHLDEVKYAEDEGPALLRSMMERLSADRVRGDPVRACSPILVALAAEIYGYGDPSVEAANWVLLDLLTFNAHGKDYFAQLHVSDPRGARQRFLVSTAAFERDFHMPARIPVAPKPLALGYRVLHQELDTPFELQS